MTGTAEVIRANALDLPLADGSVDLVVTSPPYFGLRSYQDGGEHYEGQLGDEATPAEFVDALLAATREMSRVLKPEGSIWVNLGDKYSRTGGGGGGSSDGAVGRNGGHHRKRPRLPAGEPSSGGVETNGSTPPRRPATVATGAPEKSLIGVPWRYALACIDDLGLILRAEVIWSKPNGLPESVTDRVRRSHETWFHFTKQPRYFSSVDEIREPHVYPNDERYKRTSGYAPSMTASINGPLNPLGKLPGSVWTIPTQPLQVPDELGIDHFAAFPMEWPRRIIKGWSPVGVCVECGQGRRPVKETEPMQWRPSARLEAMREQNPDGLRPTSGTMLTPARHTITGYACGCDEPTADTIPAVVLDPFGGTGTTATVAKALGRHGISVDLSADYCRLAQWRTNDPAELAKAAQAPKPQPVADGQMELSL